MINNKLCPLCKKPAKVVFVKGNNKINRCTFCGLGYLVPKPSRGFLRNFYREKYFKKESSQFGYRNYSEMNTSLRNEAIRKIKVMNKYCENDISLIDVGSGPGDFAIVANKFGFNAEVLDISSWAIGMAKGSGLKGYVSDLSEKSLPRKSFYAVTAWDVIEHFDNPLTGMRSLNKLLKTKGFLFITTPNIDSLDAKIFGKYWYGFKKIPEHILYFSPDSIRYLAKKTGFRIIEIKNWGFVRNLEFITEKTYGYNKFLGTLAQKTVSFFHLKEVNIFLPLTDMIVVLQKQ